MKLHNYHNALVFFNKACAAFMRSVGCAQLPPHPMEKLFCLRTSSVGHLEKADADVTQSTQFCSAISLICNTLRQVLIICITYLKDLKNEANYDHLSCIYHWPCCCCRPRVSSKGCSHNLQRSVLYR